MSKIYTGIEEKILEIITEINPYVDINKYSKLIEEKIIDSLGIMVLIQELETEFEINIQEDDISIDNFKDIAGIEALVLKSRRI